MVWWKRQETNQYIQFCHSSLNIPCHSHKWRHPLCFYIFQADINAYQWNIHRYLQSDSIKINTTASINRVINSKLWSIIMNCSQLWNMNCKLFQAKNSLIRNSWNRLNMSKWFKKFLHHFYFNLTRNRCKVRLANAAFPIRSGDNSTSTVAMKTTRNIYTLASTAYFWRIDTFFNIC